MPDRVPRRSRRRSRPARCRTPPASPISWSTPWRPMTADLVIVLDDCHLADEPEAVELLRRLVERMPPFGHLVLIGREDPALPLGRLRAHGALVELRADDLRFTLDESLALMADAGVEPDAALVEGLVGTTEGWAAALQLASITLRAAEGPRSAAEALSGTHRHLIDYLGDEVMAGLDAETPRAPVRRRRGGALHGRSPRRDDRERRRGGPAGPRGALQPVPRAARRRGPLVPDARPLRRLPPLPTAGGRAAAAPRPRGRLVRGRRDGTRGPGPGARGGRSGHGDPPRRPGGARRVRGRRAPDARAVDRARCRSSARESDLEIASLEAWARFYTGDLAGAAIDRGAGHRRCRRPVGRPGEAARPARAGRHDDAPRRRVPGA